MKNADDSSYALVPRSYAGFAKKARKTKKEKRKRCQGQFLTTVEGLGRSGNRVCVGSRWRVGVGRCHAWPDFRGSTLTLSGQPAKALAYAHAVYGSLSQLTHPNGEVPAYAPDALGRPIRVGNYLNGIGYLPNEFGRGRREWFRRYASL